MKNKLYLINGALGSGKTTLLQFLLKQPDFKNVRVIENEFASSSIDSNVLKEHAHDIETIAGGCICCSTGTELVDILNKYAKTKEPVIIESTGVANTLKVVEQLILSDVLEKYEITNVLYIVDSLEYELKETIKSIADELRAADLVLLSKTDMISRSKKEGIIKELEKSCVTNILEADYGVFDLAKLKEKSDVLDYFVNFNGVLLTKKNPFYSVIDTEDLTINEKDIPELASRLKETYGLVRIKGGFSDGKNIWHIEATPKQVRVNKDNNIPLKMIFIGQDAHKIGLKSVKRALDYVNSKNSVNKLLMQYASYKELVKEIDEIKRQLAKQKLLNKDLSKITKELNLLEGKQSKVSDSMVFKTPIVWLMYKFLAYKDEPQPMNNLRALKDHCSNPNGICTKRFKYINRYLKSINEAELTDKTEYPDELTLDNLFDKFLNFNLNRDLIADWQKHEFYEENGIIKKWKDASFDN